MKVAIVYDRVNKWGGAERVLLAIHEIFPKAPLYTSVYDYKNATWAKVFPKIETSFLQKIPFIKSSHEFFGWLMPTAFESFNFDGYDLVISVTSEAAKGIKTNLGTLHICYCLTPTRYLWSHYDVYFRNFLLRLISKPVVFYLRNWDKKASQKPDVVVAISWEVKRRIKKYYRRRSELVFPPVDVKVGRRRIGPKKYYLLVSRLDYGYKKVELAIETFNKIGKPLVIVGTGREKNKLVRLAKSNIKFAGRVSEKKLVEYYRNSKALIMPQEEDFGIVAVEAQSHGIPVVAYKKGGVLDTVIDGKTGVLFGKQTIKSLSGAIDRFEKMNFKADNLKRNAKRFSKKQFKKDFVRIIQNATKGR